MRSTVSPLIIDKVGRKAISVLSCDSLEEINAGTVEEPAGPILAFHEPPIHLRSEDM
jgi:hypothetical protein